MGRVDKPGVQIFRFDSNKSKDLDSSFRRHSPALSVHSGNPVLTP